MFSLVPNNTHYRALLFTGAEVVVGETKIQRVFFFLTSYSHWQGITGNKTTIKRPFWFFSFQSKEWIIKR